MMVLTCILYGHNICKSNTYTHTIYTIITSCLNMFTCHGHGSCSHCTAHFVHHFIALRRCRVAGGALKARRPRGHQADREVGLRHAHVGGDDVQEVHDGQQNEPRPQVFDLFPMHCTHPMPTSTHPFTIAGRHIALRVTTPTGTSCPCGARRSS